MNTFGTLSIVVCCTFTKKKNGCRTFTCNSISTLWYCYFYLSKISEYVSSLCAGGHTVDRVKGSKGQRVKLAGRRYDKMKAGSCSRRHLISQSALP